MIRGAYVLALVLAVASLALTWEAPFNIDGLFFAGTVRHAGVRHARDGANAADLQR